MDYEKMSLEDFKYELLRLRESIYKKTEKVGSIQAKKIMQEEFERICVDAVSGDPICEDLLAEWFRNGNEVVKENLDTSMQWLILAGANGNKFSIQRLKLHFDYAFDRIIDHKDFGKMAYNNNINEYNYEYAIGKLLCDAIVDDLKIDALELAKKPQIYLPFNGKTMRRFDDSITKSTDVVINYLLKQ